jgi:hypothetical protein
MSESSPPLHLCCPVTLDIFLDPVLVMPEGHTFERSVITRLTRSDTGQCRNPLTRKMFSPVSDIAPNLALRSAVMEWKQTAVMEWKQTKAFLILKLNKVGGGYTEYTVIRSNGFLVIENQPYYGLRTLQVGKCNLSGRRVLPKEISRVAKRDILTFLNFLSVTGDFSEKSGVFRLFWLIFVCRFEYPFPSNEIRTLTIDVTGDVWTETGRRLTLQKEINFFLLSN